MSTNDYILNLLNIKDKNVFILSNKLENRKIKGINYQIIEAILTYNPNSCPICGCINNSTNDIIKWGFRKNCKVKIPNISNCKSLMLLTNVIKVLLILLKIKILINLKILFIIIKLIFQIK